MLVYEDLEVAEKLSFSEGQWLDVFYLIQIGVLWLLRLLAHIGAREKLVQHWLDSVDLTLYQFIECL